MGTRRASAARTKVTFPRRGEVYLVTFDPTVGAEIKKTRPAVVIQNDIGNRAGSTTIVAAVSSQVKPPLYPFEVLVSPGEGGLPKESVVLLNQIRTVDRRRLIRHLGTLSARTMAGVDHALLLSLGLLTL
jgi:mRNA interferase MazF